MCERFGSHYAYLSFAKVEKGNRKQLSPIVLQSAQQRQQAASSKQQGPKISYFIHSQKIKIHSINVCLRTIWSVFVRLILFYFIGVGFGAAYQCTRYPTPFNNSARANIGTSPKLN